MNDKFQSLAETALERLERMDPSVKLRRLALDQVNSASAVARLAEQISKSEKAASAVAALATLDGMDTASKLARTALAGVNSAATASRVFRQIEDADYGSLIADQLAKTISSARFSDDFIRKALVPASEYRAASEAVSQVAKEVAAMKALARDYEARFVLPDTSHVSRLFSVDNYAADIAKSFLQPHEDLLRSIEALRMPWLDTANELSSLHGVSALQGIGSAVEMFKGFDDRLSDRLRAQLGDWRDPITFQPIVYDDIVERTKLYLERGLNTALTDLPSSAFREGLEIAHLYSDALPAASGYQSRDRADGKGNDNDLQKNREAYGHIYSFESHIRALIDTRMTAQFGKDWPKSRLPNGLHDEWQERKKKAEREGSEEYPLIAYADFTDYERVILKRDNWQVFSEIFIRPESLRESLQRLSPLRVTVMHCRMLTQDDELFLRVEIKRLMRSIRTAKGQ